MKKKKFRFFLKFLDSFRLIFLMNVFFIHRIEFFFKTFLFRYARNEEKNLKILYFAFIGGIGKLEKNRNQKLNFFSKKNIL